MITDTPKVKISGITHPVYALDYDWGGGDGPSKLVVQFVNTNGAYSTPALNTTQVVNIKCGDFFTFAGFPVAHTISKSNQGDVMSITYWDTSIILDKVFVGLKGLHGPPPPKLDKTLQDGTHTFGLFDPAHVVLVGRYVDPCEGITPDYLDPCNPCVLSDDFQALEEANYSKKINCQTARETNLLDVNYTFQDLLAALGSRVRFYNTPNIKNTYYARYTGTAREVLRAWCQDLGFTFFWHQDGVYFIDLKKGLTINDTNFYDNCALLDSSTTQSIEDNRSMGNIFYFGAEGRLEDYNCSASGDDTRRTSLLPITLTDVFTTSDGQLSPYIKAYYTLNPNTGIHGLQTACVLSHYSSLLRDMVLMYQFYDINQVKDAVGKYMPLLGMKIKDAWDVTTGGGGFESVAEKIFWAHIPESIRQKATTYGAALCIIQWKKSWHERFSDFERKLADNFIGQYWIDFFTRGDQYTYQAPDGRVEYYDAGSTASIPFVGVLPESIQHASPFLKRIVNLAAQRNKGAGKIGDVVTDSNNLYANRFLLMQRGAAWEISQANDIIRQFEDNYKDFYFYNVEPFKTEGVGDTLQPDEFYALIFNKPGSVFSLSSSVGDHPSEKLNQDLEVTVKDYKTHYGLRSAACKAYSLQLKMVGKNGEPSWNTQINFYMPVQAHDSAGSNFPGYTIIATKNSEADADTRVFIPRTEVILGDVPPSAPNTVGIIINLKDVSSATQNIITQTTTSCQYSVPLIRDILESFKVASARPQQITKTLRNYSLGGFPTRTLTPADGLSSLSVRFSGENGISSTLTFSNLPPITKSESVIDQEVEKNRLKRYLTQRYLSSHHKVFL